MIAALDKQLDEIISVIAQAQETNGYIDTWVQLHQRAGDTNAAPFSNPENFEMYNFGQLMTSACVHYRATGKTNFLAVACKAADFLCDEFKNPTPALANNLIARRITWASSSCIVRRARRVISNLPKNFSRCVIS